MSVEFVLDASALLALVHREPGELRVGAILERSAISTVNLVETFQSVIERGTPVDEFPGFLAALGVVAIPLTVEDADAAAALRAPTRDAGLSLADRCCLALAKRLGATAVTADRAWTRSDHGIAIELIG